MKWRSALRMLLRMVCGATMMLSCTRGSTDKSSRAAREPHATVDPSSTQVQWLFEPDSTERVDLNSAMASLRLRLGLQAAEMVGELQRLGPESLHRYLLTLLRPGQVHLYQLYDSAGHVGTSPPFILTSGPGPDDFAATAAKDLDGDGNADLLYCVWPAGQTAQAERGAVGFRDGAWHRIPLPNSDLPLCTPSVP